MTDSRIRLYQALTDIDDAIIEEVQSTANKRVRQSKYSFLAVAASFCLILAGVFVLFSHRILPADQEQPSVAQPTIIQPQQPTSNTIDSTPSVPDYSAIDYSSLALPAAQPDPTVTERFSDYSVDIAAFNEACLSDCCGILEGTIKSIYPKHYTYDFYDDKFGESELYHGYSDSIVYELAIEKVWCGAVFEEGTTILVEDEFYFPDVFFSLMEGRNYVIPICEYGDTVRASHNKDIASGDLSRDSIYSTLYPFHPQITKTEDGCYLVTTDWQSLAAEPCRVVNMENEAEYSGFFKDKLRLVYAEDFEKRLITIIHMQLESD